MLKIVLYALLVLVLVPYAVRLVLRLLDWLLWIPQTLAGVVSKKNPVTQSLEALRHLLSTMRKGIQLAMERVAGWAFPYLLPVLKYAFLLALAVAVVWATIRTPLLPVVVILAYLIAWKLIPWFFVSIARLLGFEMKMTPITKKRVARFKRIKRGYYSFIGITTLFVLSLFLEMLVNSRPLVIHYQGRTAYPAVMEWLDGVLFFTDVKYFEKRDDFGQVGESEVDYPAFERWSADPDVMQAELDERKAAIQKDREAFAVENPEPAPDDTEHAKRLYASRLASRERGWERLGAEIARLEASHAVFAAGDAWSWMPLYEWGPNDFRDLGSPPNKPSLALGIPLGTDDSGRDVVPLLLYGFRISLAFALLVATLGYSIGIVVGGIQGYYGGWVDILSQRFVEIWGTMPFLFIIMIIASMIQPTFGLLIILLVLLRSWLGITYYVRGEFYREKSKDYVQAAIGSGVADRKIILKHILPNSLVPVVTFAPFGIVAYIGSLVSLDYLGFGLPTGTPSWGALLRQGLENVKFYPHLAIIPSIALATTLFAVVMVGEAVREAFDPKVFSRLR